MRGTPNRGQGRGGIPVYTNSPSNMSKPTLESHPSTASYTSEAGTSTISASRQKKSRQDEVGQCSVTAMKPLFREGK